MPTVLRIEASGSSQSFLPKSNTVRNQPRAKSVIPFKGLRDDLLGRLGGAHNGEYYKASRNAETAEILPTVFCRASAFQRMDRGAVGSLAPAGAATASSIMKQQVHRRHAKHEILSSVWRVTGGTLAKLGCGGPA
jgi:hypothetical protein